MAASAGPSSAPYSAMDVDTPGLGSNPAFPETIDDDDNDIGDGDDDSNDEDDPVVGEYEVYITPRSDEDLSAPHSHRNVYLLQFPNRSTMMPYREDTPQAPLAVRVKPQSGFLEMDVSIPTGVHMDRAKAVRWSQAMRDAEAEGITEFGMSAGFTSRVVSARTGFGDRSEFERETEVTDLLETFDDADRQGKVLNKQVLGGQILKNASGRPFYMIGAFRNNTLHLSPLAGVVRLRPQFHYLDARKKLESLRKYKDAVGANAEGRQPKAIQQTMKTEDEAAAGGDGTKSFLQAAQDEPWVPLPFVGEDTNLAYEAYNEWLFVNDTDGAAELKSTWTDEEYLDAISVPHFDPIARTRRRPLTKTQIRKIAEERNAKR